MMTVRSRFTHALLCLMPAALLFAGISASSQETRATLNGHVQDPSGATIPNATITVKNAGTSVVTKVTASDDGNYTIPFLAPGVYSVTASANGFRDVIHNNVELHVQDKLTVDLSLSAGGGTETVTVNADPPLLDEGSATRGGLVDNIKVTELPIIGRNPINLADLIPGVVFQGNQSASAGLSTTAMSSTSRSTAVCARRMRF